LEDDADVAAWIPRGPEASIVQSLLEEFYLRVGAVEREKKRGLVDINIAVTDVSLRKDWSPDLPTRLLGPFEQSDVEWLLSFTAAKALKSVKGQHEFPTNPPTVKLGDKARVILVGDWGSGIPRAVKVGKAMRKCLQDTQAAGRDLHVIHLGDVYYSGFQHEYKDRFLSNWPVLKKEAGKIGSWCLNGNHDMFTGGHAYFDFLLKDGRFSRQAGASYFAVENDNWQLLGLDTAYDPPDIRGEKGTLFGPQARWVMEKRAAVPQKKAILLSHHQLFSPYEGDSPKLDEKLAPVINDPNGITAWFWGHEHRCTIYDDNHRVKKARLIGHGGVPVYALNDDLPTGVTWEFKESFSSGLESFARFGFAVLDFDSDKLKVRYLDEDGAENYAELIQ
jgi:hypothetical protein